MWWKKEQSENWKELIKLLELMRVTLAEHTAQISLINGKLLKRLPKTTDEEPTQSENVINDGFDDIRKNYRKEHGIS